MRAAEELFAQGAEQGQPQQFVIDPAGQPQSGASTAKERRRQKRETKGKATAALSEAPAAGAGDRFDVPRPGGRLSGGRGTHVAARMTALVSVSLLALGAVGVMAYTAGHPAPVETGITDEEVSKYRLTPFPVERAIAFADRYARLCANQNPEQADQRRQAIARLSSAGVDPTCGWDGKGNQVVAYSVWSGVIEPIAEYPEHGFYIGIQVQLTTGGLRTLSVPVWVDDLKSGNGMRVVGDVGTLPQPDPATPPAVKDPLEADSALSTELQGKLFADFFTSWGASNGTTLSRYVAPGASTSARAGLRGALGSPQVSDVQVLLPKGVGATDGHEWGVDDVTWARVSVRWKPGSGHVTERYRVQIVLTDQGWFVKDIRAGVIDQEGGKSNTS
ncbi:conjugal transfer protein [Streptomyces californicus]|uniref:conjugal transfer protein n=1 Tax=Streptomyces californicus TaxID=67351 RepID=UPI00296F3BBA|nr:conjugal transfer protein [Streptomyces californicus]MDW4912504.1 conjugal transfer protein [Streptomyces californicus]